MLIKIKTRRDANTTLALDGTIERGNLDETNTVVVNGSGAVPQVAIVPRLQTTTGVTRWWYFAFEVSNTKGRRPTFTVDFGDNYGGDPVLSSGYTPWFCTDRSTMAWHKFSNVSFSNEILTFSNDLNFSQDSVLVSYLPMWGLTESNNWIAELKQSAYTSPAPGADAEWIIGYSEAQVDDISRTIGALPIHLFKLTNSAVADAGKKVCYMDMGIHGAEDMGNFAGKAMIDYILSPAGADLLDDWIFIVCPMANPPGRNAGHYRGSWSPLAINDDTNRSFNSTPTIGASAVLKSALDTAVLTHSPDVGIAWHAWQSPVFGYYDDDNTETVAFRAAVETVSGETHHRHGDFGSGSVGWYYRNKGADIGRVVEVGQNAVETLSQMTDLGRWHAEALRLV